MTQYTTLGDAIERIRPSARPARSFERARRHSRRVRYLKIGIPIAAVLLVALFSAWAWLSSRDGISARISGASVTEGKLVMSDAKLNGFTRDNLPYSLSAQRAVQDLTDTKLIQLDTIVARLPIDPENWADIAAASGVFDERNNVLDIDSAMTIKTTSGIVAEFRSAKVDIGTGTVTSDDPISVEMDGSRLEAGSMQVSDRGKVVVFRDQVRMTIAQGLSGAGNE